MARLFVESRWAKGEIYINHEKTKGVGVEVYKDGAM
jgi:hypothetical protein